ncbi:MAG TPA: hypothetical protein VF796_28455 [Humisphaera sp.]
MPSPRLLCTLALLALGALTGCASYEHEIVAPPELARPVKEGEWVTVDREPLEYRLITVESRLVMRIYNRTDEPIQLVGDRSVAVDPNGQSHPLASQPIAPGSFARIHLPPRPPQARAGPRFGFGVGLGFGGGYYHRHGFGPGYFGSAWDDPFYDTPRYYAVYDPNDPTFWEWPGEGDVRLTLTFERGGKLFTHDWVFGRRKT